ncbi:MAG: P63C domain-containing protein [Gemmatimonadetes bacterium]|nr:P63C domain-containing protein [Gemmatimonadota bacterium]
MSQKELDRITDKVMAYDPNRKDKPLKVIAGAPDRPLVIGDIEIPCYVLEDETRVLSQRGLQSGIGMSTGGASAGAHRIAKFVGSLESKGIAIKDLTARSSSPIEFQPPGGGRTAYAYPAALLVDICKAVLLARDAGILTKQQEHIAKRCDILIRGLATVGVIALVDEATGYQQIREERALATILERFIAEELQPWTRTFPFEFYTQICRLRNWPSVLAARRPSVIGKYTNDFVYERIAPGVLEELKSRTPRFPSGALKYKYFQWFTPDYGHPKLQQHLWAVVALMRAASSWETFKRSVDRAFPKQDHTIPLSLNDPEE